MNAKQEFLEHTKGKGKVVCAKIGIELSFTEPHWYILQNDYTDKEFKQFCNKIDFDYDAGYGVQELRGIILFTDSYSDRGEYDGSEWWDNHKISTIEEVLDGGEDE